jgi:AraC-like DNA-binding protein
MERRMPTGWMGVVTGLGAVRQFEDLHLPCSLVTRDQKDWLKVWGTETSVTSHEVLQGVESARSEYNHRCLTQVERTKRALVGTHAGFSDAFVPIFEEGRVSGFLVSGSFATSPWRAKDILEQWQKLTGRPARTSDPELLSYAQAVLATPVLPKRTARALLAVLGAFAAILSHPERIEEARRRWHLLTERYLHRRLHFNMWQMAQGLVDPVELGAWSAVHRSWARRYLGLTRLPTLVLAIRAGANQAKNPLETLVEDHDFVVDCADTAIEIEDAACGTAGGTIAYFLLYCDPALPQRGSKKEVRRLVDDVRSRLKKKGHRAVQIGASAITPVPKGLARCLREALLALDWAVHKNEELVFHADQAKEVVLGPARFGALFDLNRALREGASEAAWLAVEGLVNEIVWQSGANVISARAYADAFYSQALRALSDLDLVEPSIIADHLTAFGQTIEQASTVNTTIGGFRNHVRSLIEARKRPRTTRRDAKLARALNYLEAHAADDVKLTEVSKMAGYAPRYFSRLLYKLRRQTFEKLVLSLRLARAKELLRSSELVVSEVAVATGFRSLAYFHRTFLRDTGQTPAVFRAAYQPASKSIRREARTRQ